MKFPFGTDSVSPDRLVDITPPDTTCPPPSRILRSSPQWWGWGDVAGGFSFRVTCLLMVCCIPPPRIKLNYVVFLQLMETAHENHQNSHPNTTRRPPRQNRSKYFSVPRQKKRSSQAAGIVLSLRAAHHPPYRHTLAFKNRTRPTLGAYRLRETRLSRESVAGPTRRRNTHGNLSRRMPSATRSYRLRDLEGTTEPKRNNPKRRGRAVPKILFSRHLRLQILDSTRRRF